MAWTKTKTAVVTGAAIILALGVIVLLVHWVRVVMAPDIQGAWQGTIAIGGANGAKLRGVVKLTKVGGSYRATGDVIDQRAKDQPISAFAYHYPAVHFEETSGHFIFDGTLNQAATEMSGTWKQRGASGRLVLKRTAHPDTVPDLLTLSDYAPRDGSDLQGNWKGTLNAGKPLRLALKIAEPTDGTFRAELDSLDQNAFNMVVSSFTYDKPAVRLEVGVVGGVFQGDLNSSATEIAGTWTQQGRPLPLTFYRADAEAGQTGRSIVGIGVALKLDQSTRRILIQDLVPNSPAAEAGLLPGSIVQKIDDVSTAGIGLAKCAEMIRGAAGTKVRLELVVPDRQETNSVEVTRRSISF